MSVDSDAKKRRAARAALGFLEEGAVIGVGTGSTVGHFIEELAGSQCRVPGAVSSSNATTARLLAAGIPVLDLNDVGELPLYIDGADEATAQRHLIKGGGGALTREKIVAAASRQFVCIIDEGKYVATLGQFPLPIEVIPMARALVARKLAAWGGRPVWREGFVTDNGNHVLDIHGLTISDAPLLERELDQVTGVVTVGLFALRPADVLLIGTESGTRTV
jgi:ribose 5-phosphate isomerase A